METIKGFPPQTLHKGSPLKTGHLPELRVPQVTIQADPQGNRTVGKDPRSPLCFNSFISVTSGPSTTLMSLHAPFICPEYSSSAS